MLHGSRTRRPGVQTRCSTRQPSRAKHMFTAVQPGEQHISCANFLSLPVEGRGRNGVRTARRRWCRPTNVGQDHRAVGGT
jgi:hypothetical protein